MEHNPIAQSVSTEFSPPTNDFSPKQKRNMGEIAETYGATMFFMRWGAHVIDHILLLFFIIGMYDIAYVPEEKYAMIFVVALFIGVPCYFLLLEGLTGYTIGKFAIRIKAVDSEGRPPGFVKSVIRSLLRIIETNPMFVGGAPAGISVLVTKRKQRLGDLAANTFVVKVSDLNNESKRATTIFAVVFSILALFFIISGILGIASMVANPPR